jgi:hypothetical protein
LGTSYLSGRRPRKQHPVHRARQTPLWAFDIQPKQGVEYDIFAYTEGFNIRPKKFECIGRVRSKKHRMVLAREFEDAQEVIGRFPLFREG